MRVCCAVSGGMEGDYAETSVDAHVGHPGRGEVSRLHGISREGTYATTDGGVDWVASGGFRAGGKVRVLQFEFHFAGRGDREGVGDVVREVSGKSSAGARGHEAYRIRSQSSRHDGAWIC